jgi:ligand-binding SRPBCC domain-containing protein
MTKHTKAPRQSRSEHEATHGNMTAMSAASTQPIVLRFASTLPAPRQAVWQWITSWAGIRRETMPYFAMTAPRGMRSIAEVQVVPGQRLFRSYLLFGGLLPLDILDLTVIALEPGRGFTERSPMLSMKQWQHQREILDAPGGAVALVDTLTFQPRLARGLTRWFVTRLFEHRHAVLRRAFHGTA